MIIKPHSSFTSAIAAKKFPSLLMYFHADDLSGDGLTLPCRVSGVTANFAAAVLRDATGLYTTTSTAVSSVTGTMPTLQGGMLVAVCIGTPSAGVGGATALNAVFGIASGANYAFGAAGVAWAPSAAQNTAPSASLTTVSKPSCQLTYYDLTDVTGAPPNPVIRRILVNNYDNAASNQTGTTTAGASLAYGQLGAGLTFNALTAGANSTARFKIGALFEFNGVQYPSANELQLACAEMVRTQQLYAGWFNKPRA